MKRPTTNQQIAQVLAEIGEYLAMQNVPFKPRAYEKAAETISSLQESLGETYARGGLKALREISGVGEAIAKKIEEFIRTGKMREHERLKKATPVDLAQLTRIEGLGPQSVRKLYEKLGIKNIKDLEKAAKAGKIRDLPGFGRRSEEKILKGISFSKAAVRRSLGFVLPLARSLEMRLGQVKGVERVVAAGSLRRRRETIGDIDLLAVARDSRAVMDAFVRLPEVSHVYARGPTKTMVRLRSGLDVDLRVVPQESYGAALLYFTGSKDHNVALREIAIKKGYKLNEYSLSRVSRGKEVVVAGRTEEEIYKALRLHYVEPEMRENAGEIELARHSRLPRLISYGELKGDLQVQTDWTDGKASIEEMARAAMAAGLQYIAITDHTKRLAMARGLDEKRLLKQMAEIDRVNRRLGGRIKILKGTECDILRDGTLDLPDSVLSKLDVVGISVHSYFNLPREEQSARIIRAISNPHADILFHPTGRLINRRAPYEVDMAAVIAAAKRTGTVLEIDAFPDRLDMKDEYIRQAAAGGVKMAIDSDAHATRHFEVLEYGIAQARRGWAKKTDIINAWPLSKCLAFLKSR